MGEQHLNQKLFQINTLQNEVKVLGEGMGWTGCQPMDACTPFVGSSFEGNTHDVFDLRPA